MTTTLESLGMIAATTAMRGMAEYIQRKGFRPTEAQMTALVEAGRRHAKAALSQALADAKEALDCHMDKVAEMTFQASMFAAGIAAAKEVLAKEVA